VWVSAGGLGSVLAGVLLFAEVDADVPESLPLQAAISTEIAGTATSAGRICLILIK